MDFYGSKILEYARSLLPESRYGDTGFCFNTFEVYNSDVIAYELHWRFEDEGDKVRILVDRKQFLNTRATDVYKGIVDKLVSRYRLMESIRK